MKELNFLKKPVIFNKTFEEKRLIVAWKQINRKNA